VNLPNKLTVLRAILIPVFLFFMYADFIPFNFTIALLQQIQNMKENYGDDALLASKALLKIAGGQPQ